MGDKPGNLFLSGGPCTVYNIYCGRISKDSVEFPFDTARMLDLLTEYGIDGATILHGQGVYLSREEPCFILNIIDVHPGTLAGSVRATACRLRDQYKQNEVLVTAQGEAGTAFYTV